MIIENSVMAQTIIKSGLWKTESSKKIYFICRPIYKQHPSKQCTTFRRACGKYGKHFANSIPAFQETSQNNFSESEFLLYKERSRVENGELGWLDLCWNFSLVMSLAWVFRSLLQFLHAADPIKFVCILHSKVSIEWDKTVLLWIESYFQE